MEESGKLDEAVLEGSIFIVGFGTPVRAHLPEDERGPRIVWKALEQVISLFLPPDKKPALVLVGPEGVIETANLPGVVNGQSSMVAVQSLLRHYREEREKIAAYCLEMTKDTPSLLPWRLAFPKNLVLSPPFVVSKLLTTIVAPGPGPDPVKMEEQWKKVMAQRLAHQETLKEKQ